MRLAPVTLSLIVAVAGCTRADSTGRRVEPTPTPAPRFFDEKVRCATVGERWEKTVCGGGTVPCRAWWGYNHERDTCIGIFLTTTVNPRSEMLSVVDLLTAEDVEELCLTTDCDEDGARKRWITKR